MRSFLKSTSRDDATDAQPAAEEEATEEATSAHPPAEEKTAQQRLNDAIADRAAIETRRDDLSARLAERHRELDVIVEAAARGDETARSRSRELRTEISELTGELDSIARVLQRASENITTLADARNSELALEQHERRMQHVNGLISAVEDDVSKFFAAALELMRAHERIQASVAELRGLPYSGHVEWSRLRAAHLARFNELLSACGPIERLQFPAWMFEPNPGVFA